MKNKSGKIGGFLIGMVGFLLLFKFIFLVNIPPSDELAPGAVLLLSIFSGILFALLGSFLQSGILQKGKS